MKRKSNFAQQVIRNHPAVFERPNQLFAFTLWKVLVFINIFNQMSRAIPVGVISKCLNCILQCMKSERRLEDGIYFGTG